VFSDRCQLAASTLGPEPCPFRSKLDFFMPTLDNAYARVSDFEAMEAELKATRQHLHAHP
ncbi:hypothetical protein ACC760_37740, partial [Rhizobium ruizarguesonis]